jgi:TATA-box binding protein (TBP) (component of TFIID and TFIIIB)
MGLFNKKEDIPQLSSMPTLPALPQRRNDLIPELPTLPENSASDVLNEEMIKSAMSEDELDVDESPSLIPKLKLSKTQTTVAKEGTIFVKIDKFNKSQETLTEIREKVKELSTDIQALKEIKTKEINELTNWDIELKEINSRLSRIDSNIFSEV